VRVDDDGDGVMDWQGEGIDGSVGSVRARRVTRTGEFEAGEVVVAPSGQRRRTMTIVIVDRPRVSLA
jgi:hypothetical protein